jgi:hypothetical protein
MLITSCNCCGRELLEGGLKYVVEVRSFADFDGYLEEFGGDNIEDGINELLDTVESMDVDSLEEDVYQVHTYILCKGCRDRFASDPFQTGKPVAEFVDNKGTLH